MKKIITSILTFILISFTVSAQNYTISGYITDSGSSETLISASVFENNSRRGSVSNSYGFYSLTLPAGEVNMLYSYVGYNSKQKNFKLHKDTTINISLSANIVLNEITVTGSASNNNIGVQGTQMSAIEVPVTLIKKVPTIFGENDVLKVLQLLPGVQGGVEGSAGFYVRGGGPDENLFLLDGVPVYNVNHLGGLFSVFNADAIKNVTLYKGSFPARFGGRLSSVLDIRMNDGNNKKLKGNVSVGLISSKINLEGPLFSEKTTFNISARRTYYDILAQPALAIAARNDEMLEKLRAGYYFYDLNAKISHKFSDKDRLYLSSYMGDDVIYANIRDSYRYEQDYQSEDRIKMDWDWGNMIHALRWNHIINNKLFMNTTASFTRYRFDMKLGTTSEVTRKNPDSYEFNEMSLAYKSGIVDYGIKSDFDFSPHPNHDIKFGVGYIYHTFRPGVQVVEQKYEQDTIKLSNDTTIGNKNIFSHETTLFVEDNFSIGSVLKINPGLHYSTFIVQGQFYHSLQPRINLRALINDNFSFKAGYAMMSQYIHLLSNSNISLPTDLWVPVTKRIKPMNSHQYSAGLKYDWKNIAEFSAEGYYKSMHNLIEYKDGASFMGSDTGWEDKVSMGEGWAYGVELLAQRSFGKTTGWIGYTWSKSERLFNRPGQELNNGDVFPAKYDRRHDMSLVVSHTFNDRIDVSGSVVYSTGNAGTLALQNYSGQIVPDQNYYYYPGYNVSLPYVSQRNNFRMPDYFRVDFGVNFHKQLKYGKRTWNLSVYNATNQMNPFLIYTSYKSDYNPITGSLTSWRQLTKLTIFTLIPSISYSYSF
ncbi:MAG: TonB-dependent receptor [Paludibacter sp.]|nr:TonB-dependent receptor [Paludibacter sp.]